MPDRASRRLFTGAILKASGKAFTGDVSQKILSATACRYFIFWMCNLLGVIGNVEDGPPLWLDVNDLGTFFDIAILQANIYLYIYFFEIYIYIYIYQYK